MYVYFVELKMNIIMILHLTSTSVYFLFCFHGIIFSQFVILNNIMIFKMVFQFN